MDFGGETDLPSGIALFINSFENSIGNINPPNYPETTNVDGLTEFYSFL